MTPADRKEMAMGMKTATLNAVDQLTRSVRTAKTSPRAVTKAGAISTQMTLFLMAVRVRPDSNMFW